MPELPEVETIRRTLAADLTGAVIERVTVRSGDVVGRPDPASFAAELEGTRVSALGRRGKYLLVTLQPGPVVLVVHLRMTGRLVIADGRSPELPHTHVIFTLADGRQLRFSDVRRFGRLYLFHADELPADVLAAAGIRDHGRWAVRAPGRGAPPGQAGERPPGRGTPSGQADGCPPGLFALGPEPLTRAFSADWLAARFRGRRAPVKAILLDQSVVAGLGNIYVDEALFRAGLHPATPAGCLEPADLDRLVAAVREVLREAVSRRGTTLSDYVDGRGLPGEMGGQLAVYGRAGEPCRRCGEVIARTRVAGRGTHFCPRCQRLPG